MKPFYLDTSIVAHALLRSSAHATRWLDEVGGEPDRMLVSSRILKTELTRVLRRERLPLDLRDAIIDRLDIVPLTDMVLAIAESIVPHVRTLDAVHLASVIASGLDITVVTHDQRMAETARELGYATFDPMA